MDIRKLVREVLSERGLNEFSDDEYEMLKGQFSNSRIILSHEDRINFRPQGGTQRTADKPRGLWYGFGHSWLEWVRNEMPNWEESYDHIFLLEVNDSVVKSMSTNEELLLFTEKYSTSKNKPSEPSGHFGQNLIDWDLVSNDYAGIEINPYVHSARMDRRTSWYYSWDVASGCIWDKSAIRSVTEIK
jgi:hypothetical protein